MTPLLPFQRIAAFQSLAAQVEAMGLPPGERRRLLEQARDETGVARLASRPTDKVGVTADARLTEEQVRQRRREQDRRYRERLKAAKANHATQEA